MVEGAVRTFELLFRAPTSPIKERTYFILPWGHGKEIGEADFDLWPTSLKQDGKEGFALAEHLLPELVYVGPGFHVVKADGGYSSR